MEIRPTHFRDKAATDPVKRPSLTGDIIGLRGGTAVFVATSCPKEAYAGGRRTRWRMFSLQAYRFHVKVAAA